MYLILCSYFLFFDYYKQKNRFTLWNTRRRHPKAAKGGQIMALNQISTKKATSTPSFLTIIPKLLRNSNRIEGRLRNCKPISRVRILYVKKKAMMIWTKKIFSVLELSKVADFYFFSRALNLFIFILRSLETIKIKAIKSALINVINIFSRCVQYEKIIGYQHSEG